MVSIFILYLIKMAVILKIKWYCVNSCPDINTNFTSKTWAQGSAPICHAKIHLLLLIIIIML